MFKVSAFFMDTVLQSDEVWSLGRQQQCNQFASTVSRGIVLLKRRKVQILNEWLAQDVAAIACCR